MMPLNFALSATVSLSVSIRPVFITVISFPVSWRQLSAGMDLRRQGGLDYRAVNIHTYSVEIAVMTYPHRQKTTCRQTALAVLMTLVCPSFCCRFCLPGRHFPIPLLTFRMVIIVTSESQSIISVLSLPASRL